MSEEEITLARAEHAELEARIATLIASEREVDTELAHIDASRGEHAAQDAARIDAARAAAGPLGDQLRRQDRSRRPDDRDPSSNVTVFALMRIRGDRSWWCQADRALPSRPRAGSQDLR